ncbi:MAG: hypothetical protein HY791_29995 [Deltaproteobacteria bacterium]|nr:hypothetical protein [Deltaproteobacteria bacterium]
MSRDYDRVQSPHKEETPVHAGVPRDEAARTQLGTFLRARCDRFDSIEG